MIWFALDQKYLLLPRGATVSAAGSMSSTRATYEFSRRRACYALMLHDARAGKAVTMVSYRVENIRLMDHECDEERAEG
jgi:hypothetical protein